MQIDEQAGRSQEVSTSRLESSAGPDLASAEARRCRICGDVYGHPTYRAVEMMFGSRESFDYFQCRQCGCLQIAEIPQDLGRHYPEDYYSIGQAPEPLKVLPLPIAALRWVRARSVIHDRGFRLSQLAGNLVDVPKEAEVVGDLLRELGDLPMFTRFLDVGCGSVSWWLRALSRLGFRRLTGVDPNARANAMDGNVRIVKGHLAQLDGAFDVISFHHSLEHIEDQEGILRDARARLAPGGVCVIRVPQVDSEVWAEFGSNWVELDAPRHLYLHSKNSLERVANRAGFRLEKTVFDSVGFEFWGSEQYRRGIPLMDGRSFYRAPQESDFTYREIAEFERRAQAANRAGRGGRAAFFLRAA